MLCMLGRLQTTRSQQPISQFQGPIRGHNHSLASFLMSQNNRSLGKNFSNVMMLTLGTMLFLVGKCPVDWRIFCQIFGTLDANYTGPLTVTIKTSPDTVSCSLLSHTTPPPPCPLPFSKEPLTGWREVRCLTRHLKYSLLSCQILSPNASSFPSSINLSLKPRVLLAQETQRPFLVALTHFNAPSIRNLSLPAILLSSLWVPSV